jgi:hypothetical protein
MLPLVLRFLQAISNNKQQQVIKHPLLSLPEVQVVAGSNPVAPTTSIKGLPVFMASPIFLISLFVPILSLFFIPYAIPGAFFPGQVLQYAGDVQPFIYKVQQRFNDYWLSGMSIILLAKLQNRFEMLEKSR